VSDFISGKRRSLLFSENEAPLWGGGVHLFLKRHSSTPEWSPFLGGKRRFYLKSAEI